MTINNNDDDFVMGEIYTPDMHEAYLYEDFCPTNEPFQVYISEDALREIYNHSLRGHKQGMGEIAGALVGNVYRVKNSKIKFVEVNASIPANTKSAHTNVEISDREWIRINSLLEKDPRYRLRSSTVGWYHSHPGFGIFLSATDVNTQLSHFNLEWQIAIVVDPVKIDVGCFASTDVKKQVPLYLIPRQGDKSVIRAVDFLREIKLGKQPQSTLEDLIYQEIQKTNRQLNQLAESLNQVFSYIQIDASERKKADTDKPSKSPMSAQLDKMLPAIGELNTKVQNVVNAFDELSKDVKSPASAESQRTIQKLKIDLDALKISQKNLENILSTLQSQLTEYEKKLSVAQDSLLDKIKVKLDFLQNEQRETLASITLVQNFLVETQNSIREWWLGSRRKIIIGAIAFVVLVFLSGVAGVYFYQSLHEESTVIVNSPTAVLQVTSNPPIKPSETLQPPSQTPIPSLTLTLIPTFTSSAPTETISTSELTLPATTP